LKGSSDSSSAAIERLQAALAEARRTGPPAATLPQVEALARAFGAQARWADACEVYEAFLARWPDSGDGWYNYALIRRASGDRTGALAAYDRALAVQVQQPEEVHANRSVLLGELERHEEAEAALRTALACRPGYPPALYNLALLKEEVGDWPAARKLLTELVERVPEHADALARLAHGERHQDARAPHTRKVLAGIDALLQRRQLPPADRETLLYARGKLAEDQDALPLAGRCYALGNALSRRRAGPYGRARQEAICEAVLDAARQANKPERAAPADVGPIFVCGLYRSGSTLLEQMLGAHPELAPAGELRFFSEQALLPAALPELYSDAGQTVAQGYLAMLAERFPGRSAGQLLNKQPDNLWYAGWLCRQFPGARVLVTQRDPADNAISVLAQQLSANYPWANDLDDIAHYQGLCDRLTATWLAEFPAQVRTVSYEQLVQAPQEVLTQVLEFLGRGWDVACLEGIAAGARVRTASVGQVREPVHQRSLGRGARFKGLVR
jgi:tetratricopeptide (TPR) repeat protein